VTGLDAVRVYVTTGRTEMSLTTFSRRKTVNVLPPRAAPTERRRYVATLNG
jgi:hypothetical protein